MMSTPVHDTTHPLSALKQIPPMSPALTPTFKRPAAAQLAKSPKKVKIARPTPEPFKVPYLPTRALTPSTSTAAFSSSPPRLLPSSPPASTTTKHAQVRDVPMDPIHLSAGTALIFGRHRHSQQASHTSATLRASVPSHLRHLVSDIDSPAEIVLLAQSARHASRVHAVAEYTEDTDQIRVTVIGQNGLRLNGTDRLLPGQRAELGRRDDLSISFYGTSTRLIFPAKSHSERLFTPVTEEEEEMASSLPPSSPPLGRRASTPLSDEEAHPTRPIAPTSEPAPSEREIKVEIISSAVAKLSTSPKILQVESGIDASAPAPGGVDLPALLASTVVFSGSSKLSLPDLVKHMLESQPSLRSHGSEAQWEHWCDEVLTANAMFGRVQRHGKDSSGRPLLPHYFYNPSLDTDLSRAKELGGLVRPLRTVQREGGKAIDWRPVGGGRRR